MAKPKKPKHTMILIEKGTGEPAVFLDIEPRMQTITYHGQRYFKCPSYAYHPSGATAAMYLWEGYGSWVLSHIRKKEAVELDRCIERAEAEGMVKHA